MAHRFLLPSAAALGAGLAYHTATRSPVFLRPTTYHCDSPYAGMLPSISLPWIKHQAPKPREHSTFDPTIYRQVSTGSFFGVALGLLVARFGKAITIVVGAIMLLVEVRDSKTAMSMQRKGPEADAGCSL